MAKLGKLTEPNQTGKSDSAFSGQGRENVAFQQIAPYGIISNAPTGALVVLFAIEGNESNCVGFADVPNKSGMPELKEGEVLIGNITTQTYIHFAADGTIHIKGDIIHDGNTQQNGKTTIDGMTAGGIVFETHVHPETGSVTEGPQ